MKKWHALMEVLQIPIKMLFIAVLFLGIGNLVTNPVFNVYWVVQNEYILIVAEALMRLGSFLILYAPFLFFLRLVSRRTNGIITISIGLSGYFTFLVFSMFFADPSFTQTATSALFGLTISSSKISYLSGVHYPLQTGMIGIILITLTTRLAFAQSRKKSTYGLLSFIDRDVWGMILNAFYGLALAFVVGLAWTPIMSNINRLISFIASGISNPINLFVYGISEKILSVFSLSNLIRAPFWFGSNGGTWANMVGSSIAGDVNIWTTMTAQSLVPVGIGRFITPTYVINLFAVPGMLWAMYSIYSDRLERRRIRLFFVLATIVSMVTGITLPLDIMLILLCPLLFLFHVFFTGALYGIFQAMGVSLGFSYSGNSWLGLPGNLFEFLNYVRNPNYQEVVLTIAAVGVVSAGVYFLVTKIYFRYLAIDLFKGGAMETYIAETIDAMGGIENIRMLHSSLNRIVIQVYDPTNIDLFKTRELGASRIVETKAGFSLDYGPGSGMIRRGIERQLRETRRVETV